MSPPRKKSYMASGGARHQEVMVCYIKIKKGKEVRSCSPKTLFDKW